MKIYRLIFLLGFTLFTNLSHACICNEDGLDWSIEKVYNNIKNKDLIFIGELLDYDSINHISYKFRVIKLYKGILTSDIIEGKDFGVCSLLPSQKGLWIVYGNKNDKYLDISLCDKLTRNISTLSLAGISLKLVPISFHQDLKSDYNLIVQNEYIRHLNNLTQEILILDSLKQLDNNKSYDYLLLFSLIFNLILLSIIIYMIVKNKRITATNKSVANIRV